MSEWRKRFAELENKLSELRSKSRYYSNRDASQNLEEVGALEDEFGKLFLKQMYEERIFERIFDLRMSPTCMTLVCKAKPGIISEFLATIGNPGVAVYFDTKDYFIFSEYEGAFYLDFSEANDILMLSRFVLRYNLNITVNDYFNELLSHEENTLESLNEKLAILEEVGQK